MTSIPHETLLDDLPAYALGTLDPQSIARVARHLNECAECRLILREYEDVMRLLPLSLPRTEPPATARRELLRRVHTDRPAPRRRAALGWLPRIRPHAMTAAVVVVVMLTSALYWTLSGGDDSQDAAAIVHDLRTDSRTQIVPMLGSSAAPQAVAQLLFQPGETRAGLVVSGLPPLPGDRAYQLWFVDAGQTRYDGGTFTVDAGGQAIVAIDAPASYAPGWSCVITEEPSGGSDRPTGRSVLRGSYEDYDW